MVISEYQNYAQSHSMVISFTIYSILLNMHSTTDTRRYKVRSYLTIYILWPSAPNNISQLASNCLQGLIHQIIEHVFKNISKNGLQFVGPSDFIQNIGNWKCLPSQTTKTTSRRNLIGRSEGERCKNMCTHGFHCCERRCGTERCPGEVAAKYGIAAGKTICVAISAVTLGTPQLWGYAPGICGIA